MGVRKKKRRSADTQTRAQYYFAKGTRTENSEFENITPGGLLWQQINFLFSIMLCIINVVRSFLHLLSYEFPLLSIHSLLIANEWQWSLVFFIHFTPSLSNLGQGQA